MEVSRLTRDRTAETVSRDQILRHERGQGNIRFPCSDHVLRDRNPGFLESEIGPFSDFKRKSYLMDLKSAHSQEFDFQEPGEVDRFLKMGTHFQDFGLSGKWSLCYMVRLFGYAQGISGL